MKFKDLIKGEFFSWKLENSCSLTKYVKVSSRSAETLEGKKFVISANRSVLKRK